ncbi:MAG: hypothetical protein EBR88_06945 [Betaproteobacteria bacterium]|nr:hypothetical protein [Betaproteobacteria bacterium]
MDVPGLKAGSQECRSHLHLAIDPLLAQDRNAGAHRAVDLWSGDGISKPNGQMDRHRVGGIAQPFVGLLHAVWVVSAQRDLA